MLIESMFHYLFNNNEFYNLVFSKLKPELFIDRKLQIIFNKIKEYVGIYAVRPKIKDIALLVNTDGDISDEESHDIYMKLKEIKDMEVTDNFDLIRDETEQWLLHRSCELAVLGSGEILEKGLPKGKMVELMKEAVSISLSSKVGVEYGKDANKQFDFYTRTEEVMKTNLKALDILLGGGFRRKALYMFVGKTGSGKTLWMCHVAASLVLQGYNVSYYTAEMSEEAIYKRIDSNILDFQMSLLNLKLDKSVYFNKVNEFINLPQRGRLFCKEYPTGFGNRDMILSNMEELKIKESYIPDVVILDSVNIFASSRLPSSLMGNTYVYYKAVSEEFRSIGVEKNTSVISGLQLNRESANKSVDNVDTTGASECVSLNSTVQMKSGELKKIVNLKVGEKIKGSTGYVEVLKIWPKKLKHKFRITTKKGKILECSKDHKIMTDKGLLNIEMGLKVGMKIKTL